MEGRQKINNSVYSKKVRAGKRRTYFFDVRETRGGDFYITLTESTKKFNEEGYDRHKIFVYKEDFNRFVEGLNEAVNHVKNDLLPDYDFEEYDKIHAEYEAEALKEADEVKKNEDKPSDQESNKDSIDW